MAPGIQTVKLRREFNGVAAVDSIDIACELGHIHAFIGPNGAGKTTTIRMLATMLAPSDGDALIMGHSIIDEPEEVRKQIGFVPDWFAASGSATVHEYLDFFARACRLKGQARLAAVDRVEGITGLGAIREKFIDSLSRGMQQRLSVGRALINDPPVMLMDEPAANLDPKARIEFRELVRKLAASGKAILISSHILAELSEICDSVTIIDKGRILASGSIASIMAATRTGIIKAKLHALGSREDIARALQAIDGISSLAAAGVFFEFDIAGDEAKAAQTLKRIVDGGVQVLDFRTDSGGLESVFMAVTAAEEKTEAKK